MKRFVANFVLILAAILFASTSPAWQVRVKVPSHSVRFISQYQLDLVSPASPVPIEWGREIHARACAVCHGSSLLSEVEALRERSPRDIYNLITWGEAVKVLDPRYTGKAILLSKIHPAYPAKLTAVERWSVAQYVYSGWLDPGEGEDWRDRWRDKVDSSALFQKYCSECHGERGFGDGQLRGDLLPPPRNLRDVSWLSDQSFVHIESVIRDGMAGGGEWYKGYVSGMPPFRGKIDESEIEALAEYVMSWAYTLEPAGAMPSERVLSKEKGEVPEVIEPDFNEWSWLEVKSLIPESPANEPPFFKELDIKVNER